jgi:hypothetical protein
MREKMIRVSEAELQALKDAKEPLFGDEVADDVTHGATIRRLAEEYQE